MNSLKRRFFKSPAGLIGFIVVILYLLAAILAPLLASSKPLVIEVNGEWYFPLFRYLFYTGFYTKPIDLFFNLLMLTLPLALITKKWRLLSVLQVALFCWLWFYPLSDPAVDKELIQAKQRKIEEKSDSSNFDLTFTTPYGRLAILTDELRLKAHDARLRSYLPGDQKIYTPYFIHQEILKTNPSYYAERTQWLEQQQVGFVLWPLLREFHWEDDAGGDQALNQRLPWWETTRSNRKDLAAALIFGIRVSLMVGVLATAIAFFLGVPLGALAGFYAGAVDLVICRVIEIWEAMPTFFMLLFIVALTGSKSIFLVILILGLFGWTGFSRYLRGEFFKERALPYVEACTLFGYSPSYTMVKHILPNALPPILTLLPFAILGAISSEAGLSFLGLGEEGSSSWGVLMDEGRQAFPAEAYLLWPPAVLLTALLVAIALIGDALRDALDPKSRP